jgi:hypothetical protein
LFDGWSKKHENLVNFRGPKIVRGQKISNLPVYPDTKRPAFSTSARPQTTFVPARFITPHLGRLPCVARSGSARDRHFSTQVQTVEVRGPACECAQRGECLSLHSLSNPNSSVHRMHHHRPIPMSTIKCGYAVDLCSGTIGHRYIARVCVHRSRVARQWPHHVVAVRQRHMTLPQPPTHPTRLQFSCNVTTRKRHLSTPSL